MINFNSNLDFEYGVPSYLDDNIRRIIAHNPSHFTLHGTGTYIIGKDNVAVIDPGPDDDQHIDNLLKSLEGEKISHIFITHTHKDHSPAAKKLHDITGAPTYGFGKHPRVSSKSIIAVEEGADYDFIPIININDNEVYEGTNWKIRAIHTPGHTSNHVCYELLEKNILFSGDHLMAWSTTVISPPDGNMSQYLKSLYKLLDLPIKKCWPTHGPCIDNVRTFIESTISHRNFREKQILESLKFKKNIFEIVKDLYKEKDPILYPAASLSVMAHIIHLIEKGKVYTNSDVSLNSKFYLT